jgi:hypothetical protein
MWVGVFTCLAAGRNSNSHPNEEEVRSVPDNTLQLQKGKLANHESQEQSHRRRRYRRLVISPLPGRVTLVPELFVLEAREHVCQHAPGFGKERTNMKVKSKVNAGRAVWGT